MTRLLLLTLALATLLATGCTKRPAAGQAAANIGEAVAVLQAGAADAETTGLILTAIAAQAEGIRQVTDPDAVASVTAEMWLTDVEQAQAATQDTLRALEAEAAKWKRISGWWSTMTIAGSILATLLGVGGVRWGSNLMRVAKAGVSAVQTIKRWADTNGIDLAPALDLVRDEQTKNKIRDRVLALRDKLPAPPPSSDGRS